jgi:hypothetical protein
MQTEEVLMRFDIRCLPTFPPEEEEQESEDGLLSILGLGNDETKGGSR